jgi:hypothetical protein
MPYGEKLRDECDRSGPFWEMLMSPSVEEELQAAADQCREASNAPECRAIDALPDAPNDEQGWFELLSGYRRAPKAGEVLMAMRAALPAEIAAAGVRVERYAILKAFPVAIARIPDVPVPNTIKRLYATLCTEIAANEPQWQIHFNLDDTERFLDVAQYATLRRFPAGALGFTYERLAPLRASLSVHPLVLPAYLYQRIVSMPVVKSAIAPHVNFGRKGSLILTRTAYERALWLVAKTVEMNPKLTGLNAWSWFCSQSVGEAFPNLAWMRAVFADGGAYLVDTFPSQPEGYGFAYNNRKRLKLYEEGKFCPRQTAVLWERNILLDWASRHPELAPADEEPIRPPKRLPLVRLKPAKPARHAKHNSPITLWDGMRMFDGLGAGKYCALVLLLPGLVFASIAWLVAGVWLAVPMFPVGVLLGYVFQYYFSM